MIEGLTIIKNHFVKKKNFDGNFYKIKNFVCNPKPKKNSYMVGNQIIN